VILRNGTIIALKSNCNNSSFFLDYGLEGSSEEKFDMKRNHFWSLTLLASLSAIGFASPELTSMPYPMMDEVVGTQSQDPGSLPPENIDGSKANMKTHAKVAEYIKDFNKASENDLMGAASEALVKFEELHAKDKLNLPTLTWIGYLSSITGNQSHAIETLELIRGKSGDEKVNMMNLRNLCAAYYMTQQYTKAATVLTDLNLMEPDNAKTLSLLGSSYVLSKEYSKAIAPLERAQSLLGSDPDSLRNVRVDLGISYARTGQATQAMSVFDAMLSDESLTSVQLGWMGYIYLENKRYDSAITALERANAIDGNNEGVVNNLANAYLTRGQAGDEAKAVALFEKLASMGSANPVADYNVGSIYLSKKEYAKAKPFLVRAAKSNDPFALNNLGLACEGLGENQEAFANYSKASDMRTDTLVFARNAGFAALRLKNDQMSIKYLERASSMDKSIDVLVPLATLYNRNGMGEKAMAIWMMPEVRESRKGDADYWFNLALAHASAGQSTEAEAAYRQSLQIDPDNADVVNNLGVLLWENEDYTGALDCFKKQSAMQPDSEAAKLNVAACHVKLGQINEAVDIWRGIVRTNPDRMDVRLDLADGLWNTGDTPGARFHYATVLKTQPNNARALNGLGMWALLQTQNDEAESYFRKAKSADMKFIPAYQNLAIVLERKNKKAEAVKVLEAALAMDSSNDAVKQQLARLKS
jgi:tetratricopeptide (TPR) repeat protein